LPENLGCSAPNNSRRTAELNPVRADRHVRLDFRTTSNITSTRSSVLHEADASPPHMQTVLRDRTADDVEQICAVNVIIRRAEVAFHCRTKLLPRQDTAIVPAPGFGHRGPDGDRLELRRQAVGVEQPARIWLKSNAGANLALDSTCS